MEPFDYNDRIGSADAMAEAMAAAMAAKAEADAADGVGMLPPRLSLAMAYVPYQTFENLYDGADALGCGTLFRSLDLPFYGSKH